MTPARHSESQARETVHVPEPWLWEAGTPLSLKLLFPPSQDPKFSLHHRPAWATYNTKPKSACDSQAGCPCFNPCPTLLSSDAMSVWATRPDPSPGRWALSLASTSAELETLGSCPPPSPLQSPSNSGSDRRQGEQPTQPSTNAAL